MTLRHCLATGVALLLTAVVPSVASAGFTTWAATSGEPTVFDILDDMYGLDNLDRLEDFDADATDQVWSNTGTIQVTVLAKYSMLRHTFGFLTGDAKAFMPLFDVSGYGRDYATSASFDSDLSGELFRFSNSPSGDYLASSRMADNMNGVDQMVTWRLRDPVDQMDTYIIGIEDRATRPASADYNDLILQVKVGKDPGTEPVPEPATLLLLGMGAAGLAASRRRKR